MIWNALAVVGAALLVGIVGVVLLAVKTADALSGKPCTCEAEGCWECD